MREKVRLEVAALVERSAARVALVWRLVQVEDAVDGQRAALTEPLATLATLERFLLAVDIPELTETKHDCQ